MVTKRGYMRILVIGSGGREHALCWKIAKSKLCSKLYCAPGNGGISETAELVDIKADDIAGLLNFAKNKKIDLTVVGPEIPLVAGGRLHGMKNGYCCFFFMVHQLPDQPDYLPPARACNGNHSRHTG